MPNETVHPTHVSLVHQNLRILPIYLLLLSSEQSNYLLFRRTWLSGLDLSRPLPSVHQCQPGKRSPPSSRRSYSHFPSRIISVSAFLIRTLSRSSTHANPFLRVTPMVTITRVHTTLYISGPLLPHNNVVNRDRAIPSVLLKIWNIPFARHSPRQSIPTLCSRGHLACSGSSCPLSFALPHRHRVRSRTPAHSVSFRIDVVRMHVNPPSQPEIIS